MRRLVRYQLEENRLGRKSTPRIQINGALLGTRRRAFLGSVSSTPHLRPPCAPHAGQAGPPVRAARQSGCPQRTMATVATTPQSNNAPAPRRKEPQRGGGGGGRAGPGFGAQQTPRTRTHTHTHTCARARAHSQAHTRARTQSGTHTHTHTHTLTLQSENCSSLETRSVHAFCSSSMRNPCGSSGTGFRASRLSCCFRSIQLTYAWSRSSCETGVCAGKCKHQNKNQNDKRAKCGVKPQTGITRRRIGRRCVAVAVVVVWV